MSIFENFQNELNFQVEGFWGDQGITEAADMIERFTNDDWVTLSHYHINADLMYKSRLASVLKCCEDSRAVGILVALLAVDSKSITRTAIESLSSFSDEFLKLIPSGTLDYDLIRKRLLEGNKDLWSLNYNHNILERIRRLAGD